MYEASIGVSNLHRSADTPKSRRPRLETKTAKRTGLRPVSSDLTSGLLYRSYVDNLISNCRYERAKQLGYTPKKDRSFECNQSFPNSKGKLAHQVSDPGYLQAEISEKALRDFTGIEPNSVNFSGFQIPLIFSQLVRPTSSYYLARSWPASASFRGLVSPSEDEVVLPSQRQRRSLVGNSLFDGADASVSTNLAGFPGSKKGHKAILTVDTNTSEILIANDTACKLFSMNYRQLVGRTLSGLLCSKQEEDHKDSSMVETKELLLQMERSMLKTAAGHFIPNYGKLIDIVDTSGHCVSVSLWLYPLKREATVTPTPPGMRFARRISALAETYPPGIPKEARSRQRRVTIENGRCLIVLEPVDRITTCCILGPHGRIFSADAQLADIFGYRNEADILGTCIRDLVPSVSLLESEGDSDIALKTESVTGKTKNGATFPMQLQILSSLDEETGDVLKYDLKFYILTTISGIITVLDNGLVHSCNRHFVWALMGKTEEEVCGQPITTVIPEVFKKDSEEKKAEEEEDICKDETRTSTLTEQSRKTLLSENGRLTPGTLPQATSTPANQLLTPDRPGARTPEGTFSGFVLHKDGSLINVGYQIRKLILMDGHILFCIWIFYKADFTVQEAALLKGESTDSESDFDAEVLRERSYSGSRKSSVSRKMSEQEMLRGDYTNYYDTLHQLGTGAFGAVRLAARKSDGLLVITKFMCKDKVLPDAWISEKEGEKKIPIEIFLLTTIRHPNIVQVLDVFENGLYYQLVMKKHGCGMDLFEFIDRQPVLDEELMSYIFRQIVSAVAYLDGLSIVHRDLKDENVIINEEFKCKLIDFGSAAYYQPGTRFSTFCGTLEYCSPEVLLGNKYVGPELEIWSLGILLYTLAYGENPFCTAQETIRAEVNPPWDVSERLDHLIHWCLHPSPELRATISDVSGHWWVQQPVDQTQFKMDRVLPRCEPHELKPPKYLNQLPAFETLQLRTDQE